MPFDPTAMLGEHGGQLAIAFGAGCVAGYGFCMRTIYKLLQSHRDKEHDICMDRIQSLEREKEALSYRITQMEDRMFHGQERQLAQIRESSLRIIKGDNESAERTEDRS